MDAQGNVVTTGEQGEMWIRGYNVMRGYFDDEAASRGGVDDAGGLHTGDIGKPSYRFHGITPHAPARATAGG